MTASLIYFGQLGPPHRRSQNPFAERHNEPDFLCKRDELVGATSAARRMVPAKQGLEATDLVFAQIVDRLVEDLEFVVYQRIPQIEFQGAAHL